MIHASSCYNYQFNCFFVLYTGLLERPSLSPGTPEVVYKIGILGKAGSGKTKTIALLSGKPFNPSGYAETCGIRVHDCYWPARIRERVCLFKLQFWDSGESCSKKFSYISTVGLSFNILSHDWLSVGIQPACKT